MFKEHYKTAKISIVILAVVLIFFQFIFIWSIKLFAELCNHRFIVEDIYKVCKRVSIKFI